MPRHINPEQATSTATAPYNFVPLPNKIFTVEQGIEVNGKKVHPWKMHDQFVPGTRSGWIDLKLKTLTPLFIRGPIQQIEGEWDRRDSRLRPEPFVNEDGVPLIPGSSLRGMIRNLVGLLSFSKISPVTNEKPFFRTVARDRIGIAYRNRMIHGAQKPNGGYVRKRGNQWIIEPATEVLRVHRDELNTLGLNVTDRPNPKYIPTWLGQHKACWFQREYHKRWKVSNISLEQKIESNWECGTLVLTGSAPNKKFDFLFVGEDPTQSIVISEIMLRRFHDEDQLTQWQESAFPKDEPSASCRKAKGHLRDGEPVFFIIDDSAKSEENPDGLLFFGRAQMFRFPYDLSPWDLISEELRNSGLDMAESIFGQVKWEADKKHCAIKGRVYFENALACGDESDWFEDIIVPHILASPKVTCFQHYLTQNGVRNREEFTTYLSGDHTTIRGTKNYWHRWDDNQRLYAVKENKDYNVLLNDLHTTKPNDKQHTIIRPVKDDVIFGGRIRFENLADIELGALLTALRLPDGCAHKLGMGKPLGLGSIQIDSQLYLVDRNARYTCWENDGSQCCDTGDFTNVFEEKMLAHARSSEETMDESKSGLQAIGRLQALFHLLRWQTRPQYSATAYQQLEQFRARPVLPTPHKVVGQSEPLWQEDPPRPSQQETDSKSSESFNSFTANILKSQQPRTVKPIGKGQTRDGILIRKCERWIALFDGDAREADIVNEVKISSDVVDHSKAQFYITDQSKKGGIKARFEKLV